MRLGELFRKSKEEKPAKVEQLESGNYKITTISGSNYFLEKNKDGKWQIDFKGEKLQVRGFANSAVFPEQIAYQPPEAKKGYEFGNDPKIGFHVLFEDQKKANEPQTFGNTNKIATIAKIND